jgi:hypothetical protein
MSIFQEVSLNWEGQEYKIEPNRVMGAIARVEEVITLAELAACAESGKMPLSKIAMAFGAVLRYAGVKVGDDEVYAGMFTSSENNSAIQSISALLSMMIPPNVAGGKPGNVQAAPTGGKNSSKKPTK